MRIAKWREGGNRFMIYDAYKTHLEETLGAAIKANITDATYSFHNEFYYDDKANINITIKALPGQIQLGVVQYPIQLLIECNDKFKDDLMPVLDAFALQYNEQLVSLDDKDYREYYTTSTVVGTFQNHGTTRNVAVSMEATIISFDNVARVKSIELIYGSKEGDVLNIKHLDFSFSYEAETNSTGAMNKPETKSVVKSIARSVNFAFVPLLSEGTDDLLTSIINRENSKTYRLKITFSGFVNNIVYDNYVEVKNGAYAGQLQAFPILRVSFVKSQFETIGVDTNA